MKPPFSHDIATAQAADDELAAMQDMFGADFGELGRLYLRDSPKRLAALRDAVAADNSEHAAEAAHTLSGSCSSIGAPHLAMLCQQLEIDCRSGQVDDVLAKLFAIETEFNRIAAKLQAMLEH